MEIFLAIIGLALAVATASLCVVLVTRSNSIDRRLKKATVACVHLERSAELISRLLSAQADDMKSLPHLLEGLTKACAEMAQATVRHADAAERMRKLMLSPEALAADGGYDQYNEKASDYEYQLQQYARDNGVTREEAEAVLGKAFGKGDPLGGALGMAPDMAARLQSLPQIIAAARK